MATITTSGLLDNLLKESDPFNSPCTPPITTPRMLQEHNPSPLNVLSGSRPNVLDLPIYTNSKQPTLYLLPTPPRLPKCSAQSRQTDEQEGDLWTKTAVLQLDGSPSVAPFTTHASQARTPTPFRPRFELFAGTHHEVLLEKIVLPDIFGPTDASGSCEVSLDTTPDTTKYHQRLPRRLAKMSPEAYEQGIEHIGNAMLRLFEDDSDEVSPLNVVHLGDSPGGRMVNLSNARDGKCTNSATSAPCFLRNPGVNLTPRSRSSNPPRTRRLVLETPPKSWNSGRTRTLRDITVMANANAGGWKDPVDEDVWERRGRSKTLKPINPYPL